MKTYMSLSKIFKIAAVIFATTTALTSCSDDTFDAVADGGDAISFSVAESGSIYALPSRSSASADVIVMTSGSDSLYLSARYDNSDVMSRGTSVTADNISDFGVYASFTAGSSDIYMNNVEVTEANGWAPAREYLWPGDGPLHFNAYSPYQAEASSSEGITALPTAGAMSLDFVTPADVADQFDLLYSTPREASASPCTLTFNHALTAIRFVTGAEMTPCTVSEIKISGVSSSATFNIESGEWTELSGQSEFNVEPGIALTAADGSRYVEAATALTGDDQTFFLLPQTLGSDAKISLTVEANGNTSTFEASLDGQTWTAGQTVTYRLSASAATPSLKLEICDADGNVIDKLSSKYTGSLLNYTVNSVYDDGSGNTEPIEWGMSFVDADGNTLDSVPDWIVSYVSEGKDGETVGLRTDMIEPTFLHMSAETQELRNATDINTAGGYDYYNLSNATGAPTVENTANCYLINAAGKYSLPLVYGNAVKDGATNQSAYVSTIRDTAANERKALMTFINHLGNEITDPYIYNNTGCEPADAVLVWEEKIGLVHNVSLSDYKKSLEFEIPAGFIRQGNAEVAVRDKDGTIMWSWHIWVTNFVNGSDWYTVPVDGVDYHLYPHTMGRVNAGDITDFEAQKVIMRFTQKNVPTGVDALTVDIPVELEGKTIETKSYYSFYQWGRKDPMVSAVDQFYDGEHNEIDAQQLPEHEFGTSHKEAIVQSIMHPELFITTTASDLRVTPYYINLWDIDDISMKPNAVNTPNVKTIYDPCPIGAKVPIGNEFLSLMTNYEFSYDASTGNVYFTLPSGRKADFSMLGYRSKTGMEQTSGSLGGFWTAVAASSNIAQYFHIGQNSSDLKFDRIMPLFGFGLRPVKDE